MKGPISRMIENLGREYTIRNAGASGGGRDTPDYSDDGTLVGVLESRQRTPETERTSAGEDVAAELEIRAIDVSGSLVGQGEADYPSKLVHPDGDVFEVVSTYPEDSNVTVVSVTRD